MTEDLEKPRFIRCVVTTHALGGAAVTIQTVRDEIEDTRSSLRWLWALLVISVVGLGASVYLLLNPQAIEAIARQGELLYGAAL